MEFGRDLYNKCKRLVAVRKTTHAAHDAEHVVVERIHADLGRAARRNRVERNRELERRLVDTREVARAAGLVLLGAERERVNVNTRRWRAAVVLVRLHLVEVRALTLREAVLAVELELADFNRVLALAANIRRKNDLGEEVVDARIELNDTRRVNRLGTNHRRRRDRRTLANVRRDPIGRLSASRRARGLREERHDNAFRREIVRVVEWLRTANRREPRRIRAVNERVALDDPEKLLNGVVKVELNLVRRRRDRLGTRVLDLLDEVLVALLGEAAALLRVEVDVVNIDRRGRKGRDSLGLRRTNCILVVLAVLPRLEVDVDADLVVLERNERDRYTRVAAEPELERDVERLGWRARARDARDRRLRRRARRIKLKTRTTLHEHKVMRVANDRVEHLDVTRIRRELRPDLHPVTILAVNALTTDLKLNLLDEAVTDVAEPAETFAARKVNLGKYDLDIRLVHEIGVTVDDSRDTLVKVGLAVERYFNRLYGKVRVALVKNLPERNLGVARDINILRTIRYKLHKTTAHLCLCYTARKFSRAKISEDDILFRVDDI